MQISGSSGKKLAAENILRDWNRYALLHSRNN
jgi:hypothetical protein